MIGNKYDKESLIKSLPQEHKTAMSNILDKALLSEKISKTVYCDFYNQYQQKIIETMLRKINADYQFFGGYDDAERKILIIRPNSESLDLLNIPVSLIEMAYNTKFGQSISHRDVLGTIISQGIKREKIGDIIVNDGRVQVLVGNEVRDYLLCNIEKINNIKVNVSVKDLSDVVPPEIKFKQINASVASLRLDCILEAGLGISRSKASDLITSESTFVNSEKITKASSNVKEGDIISVRKFGRIVLESVNGKTKKDRFRISVKRLI